jgi:hypothetical protein
MTSKITASILVATAALAVTPLAHANSELELISGATTVTVTTGTPISYDGTIGSWNINVTTGTILGTSGLDLTSIDATTSGTSSPLEILWSSSFASSVSGNYAASVGGTMTGGLTDSFSSYYDSTLMGMSNPLTPALVFTANPFSGSDTGAITGTATYLTEEAILSGATIPGSQTSFDFQVTPAPDGGATIALLGCAMAGLTLVRSRTGKQK